MENKASTDRWLVGPPKSLSEPQPLYENSVDLAHRWSRPSKEVRCQPASSLNLFCRLNACNWEPQPNVWTAQRDQTNERREPSYRRALSRHLNVCVPVLGWTTVLGEYPPMSARVSRNGHAGRRRPCARQQRGYVLSWCTTASTVPTRLQGGTLGGTYQAHSGLPGIVGATSGKQDEHRHGKPSRSTQDGRLLCIVVPI